MAKHAGRPSLARRLSAPFSVLITGLAVLLGLVLLTRPDTAPTSPAQLAVAGDPAAQTTAGKITTLSPEGDAQKNAKARPGSQIASRSQTSPRPASDPHKFKLAQEQRRLNVRAALVTARQSAQKAERKAQRVAKAKKRAQAAAAAGTSSSSFRIGTLNILGSQHTRGSKRYASGPVRAGYSAGLITSRGLDVVGMQEVQDDQLPVLLRGLGGYAVWPQHSMGSNGQRLQIAWRTSRFEMLSGGSVTYTFDNQNIPMPYALLKDRATGAEFWVINTHNSARNLEAQRDSATAIQISLINRLKASGKPVFILGDVNEHTEFFYKVCGATGLRAANGGGPGCGLPGGPLRVDWIMGGGGRGVVFSGYVQDAASLARASDHYFLYANVTINPGG
ncbi:MAG: endonuclease/exonuclease/phosphatase family protein [Nocardioides sp.]